MLKTSLFAAAAAVALAACAGHSGTQSAMNTTSSAAAAPAAAPTPEATPAPQATPQAAPPATPAAPTTFTDAQLRSFATAAREIQPLNAQMTSGTPEQRIAATTQVRSILQRNNLDGATYNAIAAKAQAEPAFAARIASLSPSSSPG